MNSDFDGLFGGTPMQKTAAIIVELFDSLVEAGMSPDNAAKIVAVYMVELGKWNS